MPMPTSNSPVIEDIDEFARLAGLHLDEQQAAVLREALRIDPETGKWQCPTWTPPTPGQTDDLVATRVLLGFLILDENVMWSAQHRATLLDAFHRLVNCINRLGTANGPSEFDLGHNIRIKARRTNGEEQLERLDTGTRIRFISRRYRGAGRGCRADLLIIDDPDFRRREQDLAPATASRPNPQIVIVE
ncbi:hypothetical protein [Amycolatopsis orientalis]|uniref:hypothetical protein n=1 Tax=Amycolatopsis orientalis TaxID=31958 RepID=UPI000AD719E0|nr:hypothetical protein [Amycolatopsis orientalis]